MDIATKSILLCRRFRTHIIGPESPEHSRDAHCALAGIEPSWFPDRLKSASLPIVRGLIVIGLLLGAFLILPSQPVQAQTDLRAPEVPFLTLRNRTASKDPAEYFGDERSGLRAGICRVRALDFGALFPLTRSVPAYVREEFLRVDTVRELPRAEVLAHGNGDTGSAPRLIYVHGYNTGFEKGCRRAVLLQQNARLDGNLLWFSWPSDGAMINYTHDESDLYWSVPDLADTILDMEGRPGRPLDLVAHSLGARGLVLSLYEVANRRPDARLGEAVLLAPDMDFEIFQRILPRIRPIVDALTVYVTSGDRPLALSAQLHGYPRLGQSGNDVSGLAGVEVIDLSALDVEDLTGHLYHLFSEDLGADLDGLLNNRERAAKRRGLVRLGDNLWRMKPGPDRTKD